MGPGSKRNVLKGKEGENIAAKLLHEQGHRILERNFRIQRGEIDIISVKENVLYFTEVKYWSKTSPIHPLEIFTQVKIRRMKTAAQYYLSRNVSFRSHFVSFSLALITEKRELKYYLHLF
ncbi:YraN family protein [Leptospira selangorensis]|uniref:YraN family protein n=1 Tax=Leptospira selangorensis TaxID=2484982 RepID=UPI00108468E1|nr:YraN family protein [Leptospira selangorensis]TGK02453.1 YraN family protein [Leptospira selangorensis]